MLSFQIDTKSKLQHKNAVEGNTLRLTGKAPAHVDPSYVGHNKQPIIYEDLTGCRGMRFSMIVDPVVKDGTISKQDQGISIKNATEIVLLVSLQPVLTDLTNARTVRGKMKINSPKITSPNLLAKATANY